MKRQSNRGSWMLGEILHPETRTLAMMATQWKQFHSCQTKHWNSLFLRETEVLYQQEAGLFSMIPVLQLREQNLGFRLLEGVILSLVKLDGIDCVTAVSLH